MKTIEIENYKKAKRLIDRYTSILEELILKKENILLKHLPSGIQIKAKVEGGKQVNKIEAYVAAVDEINKKIKNYKELLEEAEYFKNHSIEELKTSKNMQNQIFYRHKILGIKMIQISNQTNYSVSQLYRIYKREK